VNAAEQQPVGRPADGGRGEVPGARPASAAGPGQSAAELPEPAAGPAGSGPGPGGPRSVLDEIAAATAARGGAQARLDIQREAQASVSAGSNLTGGYAGRDISITNVTNHGYVESVAGVRVRRLSHTELDLAKIFVTPPGFDLPTSTDHPHLIVIRGPAGCGKTAAALRLLTGRCCDSIFEVAPEADVRRYLTQDPEEDAGYVLPNVSQQKADELGLFDLNGLSGRLRDRRSYLVLTMTLDIQLAAVGAAGAVLDLAARPDPHEVLGRHLAFHLTRGRGDGDSAQGGQRANALLEDAAVRELVDEAVQPGVALDRVAVLARALADGDARPGGDLVTNARVLLAAQDEASFVEWFRGLSADNRIFALALAVLNGEQYETVAEVAITFRDKLAQVVDEQTAGGHVRPSAPPRDWFGDGRTVRLVQLRAAVTHMTGQARLGGTAPVSVARFEDARVPGRLLLHVWLEYDELRPPLLRWLRTLGNHPVESVRIRAAVAVGTLATIAFDVVRALVLDQWASSDWARQRDAAAIALRNPSRNERLSDAVEALVESWIIDGSPRLRATAARAFGASLGERDPAAAMRQLERLAPTDALGVTNAICHSVTELLALPNDHGDDVKVLVLEQLSQWTVNRHAEHAMTGRAAFLIAAADLVDKVSSRTSGVDRWWPALLALAITVPRLAPTITYLWESALTSRDLSAAAVAVLTQWAQMLDDLPAGQRALVRLLDGARSPRTRTIVRHAAREWAKDPQAGALHTAPTVLALLDARSAQP
jgi:hypothetical protein